MARLEVPPRPARSRGHRQDSVHVRGAKFLGGARVRGVRDDGRDRLAAVAAAGPRSFGLVAGATPSFEDINAALTQTNVPGALRIDDLFKPDILDVQRRRNLLGQRIKPTPATGSPSRWIEKDALPGGQTFVDPQTLTGYTPGTPSRSPHYLEIKALMGAMTTTVFNTEITDQQGIFTNQGAEDFQDTIDGLLKKHDKSLWRGTATGRACG